MSPDTAKDHKRDRVGSRDHHKRKVIYHAGKQKQHAAKAKACKNDSDLRGHIRAYDLHDLAKRKHLDADAALASDSANAHVKCHDADRTSKRADRESALADAAMCDAAANEDVAAKKKGKYYTLLEKLPTGRFRGVWTIQFGDYERAVVVQEMRDMQTSGSFVKGAKYKVITTGHNQAEIEAMVNQLNGGKTLDKAAVNEDNAKKAGVKHIHYKYKSERKTKLRAKKRVVVDQRAKLKDSCSIFSPGDTVLYHISGRNDRPHHITHIKKGGKGLHRHLLTDRAWRKLHEKLQRFIKKVEK